MTAFGLANDSPWVGTSSYFYSGIYSGSGCATWSISSFYSLISAKWSKLTCWIPIKAAGNASFSGIAACRPLFLPLKIFYLSSAVKKVFWSPESCLKALAYLSRINYLTLEFWESLFTPRIPDTFSTWLGAATSGYYLLLPIIVSYGADPFWKRLLFLLYFTS